jgi:NAD(P)H-flavin reductase
MKLVFNPAQINKPIKGKAAFISKKQISHFVYEFVFEMIEPEQIDFKAGQYIAIEIDAKTRRQYSISSAPGITDNDQRKFEMVIDVKPNGVGVNYLMNLQPGDEIKFIGQIGLFVLPPLLKKDIYFISTGTGVAPLKSMVEDLINKGLHLQHNIYVIFGTRYLGDIFYSEIFNEYFSKNLIKDFKIYLSRPQDDYAENYKDIQKGYVTLYFKNNLSINLNDSQFFICGGNEMIKSTESILLDKGVSDNDIFYEKFY